jgi:sulfotransferase family protein
VSLLEVGDVALEDPGDNLVAHGLDTPRAGLETGFYGLDIRGWVVGRRSAAEAVTIRDASGYLRRVGASGDRPDVAREHPDPAWSRTCGFFAPLGALRLDPKFEVDLEVQLEDGARIPLARITGSRALLRTGLETRIQPIGLTALGRTGSTAVTRLLASHPEIAAYRPFEYEPRVITYWIDVLEDLAEPAAFRRQITPNGPLADNWWVGTGAPLPRRINDDVQGWLGGESIEALAAFCQSRIDGFYRRVAELSEQPGAGFFVEKLGPRTGALLREIYPRSREIFLVRDFRDVVASIFAFNRKRGFQGFGRDRTATDAEYVNEWLAASVTAFLHAWRTRSADACLMRYEDLIREPRETLERVLGDLELDAMPPTVDAMLASLTAPEADAHRTTSAADSIGRWQRDLSDEVREACQTALGPALREFGYTS